MLFESIKALKLVFTGGSRRVRRGRFLQYNDMRASKQPYHACAKLGPRIFSTQMRPYSKAPHPSIKSV